IYVDQYGELQIERGLVKPTDNANTEGQDIAGAETTTPTKVKPLHGETLCERLSAHRTAAVQAELMAQPTIALAYLMSA
ncbi:chromosome partitioning protein ParB, partial [Robbsia andropogonis]|nr:chromosome partitioning protein ParB [Robbsia andropogonis]MCP1131666.1 chromosome partitioning protein ParB [Robbsia andropogonis]